MSVTGLWRDGFRFVVEPMKVRELAAATLDADPRCHAWPVPTRVPLIFPGAIAQMARRPHLAVAAGVDVTRAFHGEEHIDCERAIRVGDEFAVESETRDAGVVVGKRGGTMRRIVTTAVLTDAVSGDVVGRVMRSVLETERAVAAPGDLSPARLRATDSGTAPPPDPLPSNPVDPSTLAVGDDSPELVIDPVTRTDFVRYAGASGDLTAVHFDEVVAAEAGFPAPFAMGMLSAGFLSHLLTSWLDVEGGYSFRARFLSPMFPGDIVRCGARVTDVDASTITIHALARCEGRSLTAATLRIPVPGGPPSD